MAGALSRLTNLVQYAGSLLPKEIIEVAEALEVLFGKTLARGFLSRNLKEEDLQDAALVEKIQKSAVRENLRKVYADWKESKKPMPKHRLTSGSDCGATPERQPVCVAESIKKSEVDIHRQLDVEAVRALREQHAVELQHAVGQLKTVEAELSSTKEELKSSRDKVEELTQAHENLVVELTQVRGEIKRKDAELHHVRSDLDARNVEVQALKGRLAQAEQASIATKCLLEEKETSLRQKEAFLPSEVSAWAALLFQDRQPEASDLAVFYSCASMLGMIGREGREFLNRFKRFDRELFLAYEDDKDILGYWRKRYQTFLNQELQSYAVTWDLEGDTYDESIHLTNDSSGSTVTSVESAMVTARSNNSCKLRALVHTQK